MTASDRELVQLAVLGNVIHGPMGLGALVAQIEDLVLGELDGSPRSIARTLHEMQRSGHIVLANDGKRWRVSLGPKGRDGFFQLKQLHSGAGGRLPRA
jgi:DNA-binding PadR family transcriptional regulator